ncbi:hypothetical protein F5B22DRAFT_36429 [Xylaria bambusicola]|uniref:uncharacterized protein n=1 Tax=Xylaria bambusicola TaxID=326684 RepID=UPI0020080D00|nr:uncharacterized protein F5B22DRAFT_36429 [Xylaria bambusicola]KAI0521057.1 hypothetical protein F5B22DRAFT_36429 [Xylaria bambusicola]
MIMMAMAYLSFLLALWATTASCENKTQSILNDIGLPPVSAWPNLVPKIMAQPTLSVTSSTPNSRVASIPNPCDFGEDFLPPVYEITNIEFEIYYPGYIKFPEYDMNVTARDTKNGYTMICKLERTASGRCHVEGSNIDPYTTRFGVLQRDNDTNMNNGLASIITLSQIWICDRESPGAYPYIYEAYGQTMVQTDCVPSRDPKEEQRDPCNATTGLPIVIEPKWRTPYNDTRLIPHPTSGHEATAPPARPGRTKDCTANAFSNPDIIVEDFHFVPPPTNKEATSNSLNFTLTSVVTGVRAFCVPTAEQDDRYPTRLINTYCINEDQDQDEGDPFQSQTEFYDVDFWWGEHEIDFKQRFICGDPEGKRETKFDISAGGFLPYVCPSVNSSGTECTSSRTKFEGTIHEPVRYLAPAPIPPPPDKSVPGCTQRSLQFSRFIAQKIFYYHLWFTANPDDDHHYINNGAYEERSLAVEILNEANNHIATCVFQNSGPGDWANGQWFPCFEPTARHTFPKYSLETWVQFDSTTNKLALNQTWYCDDTQEATPMKFVAQGETHLSGSQCGWMNITQDEVICYGVASPITPPAHCKPEYDVRWCNLTNHRPSFSIIDASLLQQIELPRNAFNNPDPEPYPDVYSCTVTSLSQPVEIVLSDFVTRTRFTGGDNHPNQTSTDVKFRLDNSALIRRPGGGSIDVFTGSYAMSPYFESFNPIQTFAPYKRNFLNDLGWTLRLDLARQYLELNQSWYCEDKDPQHPILFNATWNGYLPFSCTHQRPEKNVDEAIVCSLEGDKPVATLIPLVNSNVQYKPISDPTCSNNEVCLYPRDPDNPGGVILS